MAPAADSELSEWRWTLTLTGQEALYLMGLLESQAQSRGGARLRAYLSGRMKMPPGLYEKVSLMVDEIALEQQLAEGKEGGG